MGLVELWFVLIAVLFIGYFVLEGFDFGVGMLLPILGRGRDAQVADTRRRVLINTIGPVWDGNEVWLITAAGAMFAAFPEWYATLFSGFFLALLVILLALIVRVVAIEYRGKVDDPAWRHRCDLTIMTSSYVLALMWGVAFANIVRGVAMDADHNVTDNLLDLLNPYGLLGGVTTLLVFLLHGTVFVALKTAGTVREDAVALAYRLSFPRDGGRGGVRAVDAVLARQGLDLDSGVGRRNRSRRRHRLHPGGARGVGVRCSPASRSSAPSCCCSGRCTRTSCRPAIILRTASPSTTLPRRTTRWW